ncbi:2-oxoglutarate dehydrogenase E1 component [Puniceicoccales bacterium CK1056]|uniref:oxoglutarate dehydrogenase (succinyl-transferring) n=1 Tax=Oceanipulchritudo coccoides TaxID=2706888 RepID=A0A6B2M089_9BACT|nr:2-oxoglutarate dehydrogenase E1 component [Oceanipulchritudo coccoides]NDV61160.1 2-oxoglutarate dehydrogenase E1 component [Oceanipulchritudo coccoides]
MNHPTFANRWNADLIDEKYAQWRDAPDSLEPAWRAFFEGFELGSDSSTGGTAPTGDDDALIKQANFTGTIYAYRSIGHTEAEVNPLLKAAPSNPRLSLDRLGFSEEDLDKVFWSGNFLGNRKMSVRELIDRLRQIYCGTIGVEYLHIQETPQRRWLQSRIEPQEEEKPYSRDRKHRILDRLIKAEEFEHFLHKNYVGQKRFGLEGAETLIPAIDTLIENGPSLGVQEIVMGMAHRGRLNVLANVFRKSYDYIFHEFSENYLPDTLHGDGDVKYHLGFEATVENTRKEPMRVFLAANPSHLEAVNPVVEGRTRARQRILGDTEERKKVVPVLIHGDAAFAGQGIVAEVLNFSQLPGYQTGGTIHFVINNQIGFTTDPSEARSTLYCTDVAKMIEAPIFHVNGDDPEAVVRVMDLALAYRQEFGKDIVIDMYCYRRLGHNESDEPAFTQPTLYQKIKDHPTVTEIYSKRLLDSKVLNKEEVKKIRDLRRGDLEHFYEKQKREANSGKKRKQPEVDEAVREYQPSYAFKDVNTEVPGDRLETVAKALTRFPDSFNLNSKIRRQLQTKLRNFKEDKGIDWAFAESLAWGTLMMEGYHVRLSGQDSVRGTFSQRHAIFFDSETKEKYIPLMEMDHREGMLCVHNSLLSEAAVLGFDYGYSLDFQGMLCMWEAQFGDFVNGAQVIIDQFISSSESKWQRVSGLVMLLPHGYEGQGPEHSSARLERFLQLCAEDNIQVANLTTPAQYFHILRRQMHRSFRKPLIIMAPKSLLRHKEAVSSVADFTDKCFHSILPDEDKAIKKPVRVILCSGKVYYDLLSYRRENDIKDTAIVRIEQYYPFNYDRLSRILKELGKFKTLVWCQEEPENMGAWRFIEPRIEEATGIRPQYAGRDSAASTAVGSLVLHKMEQANLVEKAFNLK